MWKQNPRKTKVLVRGNSGARRGALTCWIWLKAWPWLSTSACAFTSALAYIRSLGLLPSSSFSLVLLYQKIIYKVIYKKQICVEKK